MTETRRRLLAAAALLLLGAALAIAVVVTVDRFPRGLTVFACLALAALVAWWAALHEGAMRTAGVAVAVALVAGAVVLVIVEGHVVADLAIVAAVMASLSAARAVFATRVSLVPAPPPSHPVLFFNPKSGGGKAERFHLADEARARGIEPVELRLGDDLEVLVRDAMARGADALAAAGGDGTQAIVASIAAGHGIPYACIPAGTRNHFALDLGVDRDDVVGALDAFVNGGERLVDLAEVNGRVFVNNVSLGVYAEAVQREGYRDAKIRTIADTAPQVLGRDGEGPEIHWTGANGREEAGVAVMMVSNDPYRLGRALGSGTRPALDTGVLGIALLGYSKGAARVRPRVEQWSAESFEVRSSEPIAAGIDGEALRLDPPLRFRSRPGALRVRIAPQHPGASPSAALPATPWDMVRTLALIAGGRAEQRAA